MFLTEKKVRSLVRQVLLREAPFDPTDVTKSFDLEKAINLARKLVLKDSVKNNEKDKEESIKISKSLAAIRDGVPGEPSQRFQTALANLLNFEGPGKEEQEYKDLLKMVRDYLGPQTKKDDGQAEKDETKPEPKPRKKKKTVVKSANVEEIQKKLNSLNFKDYRGKKLTVDGKWGKATRSATSKMLKMINEEFDGPVVGLFKKLNLNEISNDPLFDKLATGSKGPGSWKKLAIKLVQGKPFDTDDGYAAVLTILDQFSSTFQTAPSGGDEDEDGGDEYTPEDAKRESELIDAKRLGPIFVRKITAHGKKGYQKALEMGFGYKTYVFDKNAALKFPLGSLSAGDYLTYGNKEDGYKPIPNYWMQQVQGGRGNSTQKDPRMDKPIIGYGPVGSGQDWICYYVSPQTWGNIKLSGVDREFSEIKKGKVLTTDQKIPDDYEPRKRNVVWCVNKKNEWLYIFDLND